MKFSYSNETVKTANHSNMEIGINELFGIITDTAFNAKYPYERIRQTYRKVLPEGKKEAKAAVEKDKDSLHFFLLSGWQPVGHAKTDQFDYNGVIQIDIDLKYPGAQQDINYIKSELSKFKSCIFVAESITSGVKAAIATDNTDKEQHNQICRFVSDAIVKQYNTILLKHKDASIDHLGYNQPCFVPYDPKAYINHNFEPVETAQILRKIEEIQKEKELEKETRIKNAKSSNPSKLVDIIIEKYFAYEEVKHIALRKTAYTLGGYAAGNMISEVEALEKMDLAIKSRASEMTNVEQAYKTLNECFTAGKLKPISK